MAEIGTLYIVPTPIGNLDDITKRAVDVLERVDWIAAEDTRHSGKLLQHLGVTTRTMSVHEHNEGKRTDMLCAKLEAGESIALISDAGTPLISDPGYVLVSQCRKRGITVTALPGPCAAITALSAAGLPTDQFKFDGFLPVKQQALTNALEALIGRTYTTVFYEAPRRILATVEMIREVLGPDRHIVVAKELSKTFETYVSGNATDVIDWLTEDAAHQKGEFVLMIAGEVVEQADIPTEAMSLLALLADDLPLKKAAGIVAQHYGLKKNALYQAGLALKQ